MRTLRECNDRKHTKIDWRKRKKTHTHYIHMCTVVQDVPINGSRCATKSKNNTMHDYCQKRIQNLRHRAFFSKHCIQLFIILAIISVLSSFYLCAVSIRTCAYKQLLLNVCNYFVVRDQKSFRLKDRRTTNVVQNSHHRIAGNFDVKLPHQMDRKI